MTRALGVEPVSRRRALQSPSRRCPVKDLSVAICHDLVREFRIRPPARCVAQTAAKPGIVVETSNSSGDGWWVVYRDKQSRFTIKDHFGYAADAGADARDAMEGGFDVYLPEPLEVGGEGKDIGRGVHIGGVVDEAKEDGAAAKATASLLLHVGAVRSVSRDDEHHVREVIDHAG